MLNDEPRTDPRLLTLRQRAGDLHERSRLGGIFYLLTWLLAAGFADGWQQRPALVVGVSLLLALLMVARFALRSWYLRHPGVAETSLRLQWGVLLLTAGLWGGLTLWTLQDPAFAAARTLYLVSSVSLAMAFAQVFAMHRYLALVGTGLLFLPLITVVAVVDREPGLTMALLLNGVYLVAVIGRSHREYEDKLALDELLRQQRDRFARQSRIDALTGLANRGHFQESLDAAVAGARGGGQALALLIADLDHFKSINDRFGHAAGDRCLREVATLLQESFTGDGMMVARLGGEEFGVLATGPQVEGFALLAETVRARLARLRIDLDNGARLGLTASLGLARFDPASHAGGDALYAAADEALYRAKAGGRNRLEAA